MEKLVSGIHQFQSELFRPQKEIFEKLAHGQRPEALVIACSDSRVSPTFITQAKPGEVFILRNAGNLVPPYGASNGGEAPTIEYAVHALGVKDVIVCGHTHCGAMKALLHKEELDGLPAFAHWLGHAESTRRIINENYSELDAVAKHKAAIEENVLVQLENLRTHPAVAARLSRNDLRLHGWVYKIETGQVYHYNPVEEQFVTLTARAFEAAGTERGGQK
jgi:carbonic anhydrase